MVFILCLSVGLNKPNICWNLDTNSNLKPSTQQAAPAKLLDALPTASPVMKPRLPPSYEFRASTETAACLAHDKIRPFRWPVAPWLLDFQKHWTSSCGNAWGSLDRRTCVGVNHTCRWDCPVSPGGGGKPPIECSHIP